MHLSKPDIFQAALVGLSLVASAIAVPVIASGHNSLSTGGQTAHHYQQVIQRDSDQ